MFVRDSEERILLVRHSYGSQAWAIPGGGMRRGEDPLLAARREMAEELGIVLTELALIRVEEEVLSGAPHSAYLVSARTLDQPQPDRREVVEVDYFALDALPEPLAPVTRRRLDALEQR